MKFKIFLSKYIPGSFSYLKDFENILNGADKIFPLNIEEKKYLEELFNISNDKFEIIPNGIDIKFQDMDKQIAINKFGIDEFILEVGSIGPRKNQLNLIRAMKDLPYNLVLVGPVESGCKEYIATCKKEAGDNVIFAGAINNSDPLLASCYSAAKVYVLPSYSEVMPLTLYEASQAGCELIISKNIPIHRNLESHVGRVDPKDIKGLSKMLKYKMKCNNEKKIKAASSELPDWDSIASLIKNEYMRCLRH